MAKIVVHMYPETNINNSSIIKWQLLWLIKLPLKLCHLSILAHRFSCPIICHRSCLLWLSKVASSIQLLSAIERSIVSLYTSCIDDSKLNLSDQSEIYTPTPHRRISAILFGTPTSIQRQMTTLICDAASTVEESCRKSDIFQTSTSALLLLSCPNPL